MRSIFHGSRLRGGRHGLGVWEYDGLASFCRAPARIARILEIRGSMAVGREVRGTGSSPSAKNPGASTERASLTPSSVVVPPRKPHLAFGGPPDALCFGKRHMVQNRGSRLRWSRRPQVGNTGLEGLRPLELRSQSRVTQASLAAPRGYPEAPLVLQTVAVATWSPTGLLPSAKNQAS